MSRTIEAYQVVYWRDLSGLEQAVNDAIRFGWQPYGSMVFALGPCYSQPMVKYATPDNFGPM